MAGILQYWKSRAVSANADVWAMAREHVRGAVVAGLASVAALPLLSWGADLMHEAWQIFVEGVVGPVVLYGLVFVYYWICEPAKLDAKRVGEIRALRLAQGISVADLDPPLSVASTDGLAAWKVFSVLAAFAVVFTSLVAGAAYLILQPTVQHFRNIQYSVGAPNRRPEVLDVAVRNYVAKMRASLQSAVTAQKKADKLAANRLIEIQGIDGKGGLQKQVADLQGNLTAAQNAPPKIIQKIVRQQATKPTAQGPLKRLIAYEIPDVMTYQGAVSGKITPFLEGFWFHIRNVSDDTIELKVAYANASIDGKPLVTNWHTALGILAQTQQAEPQIRFVDPGLPIPSDSKSMSLNFEIDYDTIPHSGIRKSYREITIPLNWANGKNSVPLTDPKSIVAEWEK